MCLTKIKINTLILLIPSIFFIMCLYLKYFSVRQKLKLKPQRISKIFLPSNFFNWPKNLQNTDLVKRNKNILK